MSQSTEYRSASASETEKIASELASEVVQGDVVALEGDMGTGKTVFAKAFVAALGVTERVTSPTYAIVSEYTGRVPVLHLDLYRLNGEAAFDLLGIEEQMTDSVTVVEWPERAPDVLESATVHVTIQRRPDETRSITIDRARGS